MTECVVDCLSDGRDEKYYFLILNGKYVMQWAIDAVLDSGVFDKVSIITTSNHIADICDSIYDNRISIINDISKIDFPAYIISGRAPFLSPSKIKYLSKICKNINVFALYKKVSSTGLIGKLNYIHLNNELACCHMPVFAYVVNHNISLYKTVLLDENESIVIDSKNSFELALIIKDRENKAQHLCASINNRINEKMGEFTKTHGCKTVALIGHSQFDNWNIDFLLDFKVINYGIRGINSLEYYEKVIRNRWVQLNHSLYIVMHGTNDIITDLSDEQIFDNIMKTIDYIYYNQHEASIFFVLCAHVNGRLDRDNDRINRFNKYAKENMPKSVTIIELDKLDDKWGNLNKVYTTDGLHFSDEGYKCFKRLIEEKIREKGL